jgi:predicted Zn-dependent peptidase
VNVYGSYTEIIAKMNPRNVKKFLQIICKNNFSPDDLEIMKKQIIINSNLTHSCFGDAVANEIFANISYKGGNVNVAFNEKVLSSISLDDMKEYFRRYYEKCHLSIIVSGAIDEKDLRQALQSTVGNFPSWRSRIARVCTNQIQKEIYIESKHVGRSVRYFYKIPSKDLVFAEAFFHIFHYELFDFFEKANQLISDYESFYIINNGDCIRQIILYPKSDVSLATIQQMYNVFVERVCKQEIPASIFLKIQQLREFSNQFLLADLDAVYHKIKNDNLNGLNTETPLNDSKLFNALGKKFLKSNLILKIITRHKPDK